MTLLPALLLACSGAAETRGAVTPLDHLPALRGDYFPLQSREAGLYHIYVRLPDGYSEKPQERYPIVYLLDGDSTFPLLAAQHLFLTIDDTLPEAIIVGIAYGSFERGINRRHIDFMPPGDRVKPAEAGAERFHRFLETELLPAVEARVRADRQRRILVGQSRGGAMVLYSAFKRPDLFWGRIASNASFVPGREIFFGAPAHAARDDLKLAVVSGTREDPPRRRAAREWLDHWQGRPAPWTLKRVDIEGGTHAADLPNGYRAAMRWMFGLPEQR